MPNVIASTSPLETASPASTDMILLMDNAFSHQQTLQLPPTLAVGHGIGLTKNVWPVRKDGPSISITFVFQFLINVKLMMLMDIAQLAIKGMI